jgi:type II secretory pathway pseudopilin PulG
MSATHSPVHERGIVMVALLVAMTVMAIVLSTAMPVYQTVARREREAELVFRGEQYARAIAMFQRKYGNALPPSVDVLVEQRFLRKKYKDPITGDDFQYMGAGSPELAQAMATTPQQALDAQRGRGAGGQSSTQQGGRAQATPFGTSQSGRGAQFGANQGARGAAAARGPMTAAGQAGNAQVGGGLLAVASKSSEKSMRLYNGKDKYNEWIFMAVASTTAAGAPPGTGGQAPGGRGGRAGGRGGVPQGGGRRGAPPTGSQGTSPFSNPRGGFSPVTGP